MTNLDCIRHVAIGSLCYHTTLDEYNIEPLVKTILNLPGVQETFLVKRQRSKIMARLDRRDRFAEKVQAELKRSRQARWWRQSWQIAVRSVTMEQL